MSSLVPTLSWLLRPNIKFIKCFCHDFCS
jgi:hypothetical protein